MLSTLSAKQVTPAGLRKKIHRIAPNLALAWTGSLVVAEAVIGAARIRFQDDAATVDALEHFFTRTHWDFGSGPWVAIIGWVIEGETQRCFRWRSDYSGEVFYGAYQTGGSGETLIEQVASVQQSHSQLSPEGQALFVLTRMMGDEAGARQNWAKGFGFGYELLMWKNGAFDYVDDVVYVFYEVHFDATGAFIGHKLYPTLIKYHHLHGEYAFVQRGPLIVDGASIINETRQHFITPVYRLPDEDLVFQQIISKHSPVSYDSKYICHFASIIKDADTNEAAPLPIPFLIVQTPGEQKLLSVTFENPNPAHPLGGTLSVQYPPREYFEIVYKRQMSKSFPLPGS